MQKKRVLIKYGGNAMLNDDLKKEIAKKIKVLHNNDIQVVLVHGGGPFINKALEEAGIRSEFVEGHRYTSLEALSYIEKTLKGEVNSSLVSVLNKQGLRAVGLSAKDGHMVEAVKRYHTDKKGDNVDLGQVGDVKTVDPSLIDTLLAKGFTPVITCIASDNEGNDYNINADMLAGNLAARLGVEEYIVLTDVDGLYRNYPDPDSIISTLSMHHLPDLYNTIVKGGMIPKIESCEVALKGGASRAVILNGTKPEQVEDYVLSDKKPGTTIIQ